MDQDSNEALADLRHYGSANAPMKFIAKLETSPVFWILVALLVLALGCRSLLALVVSPHPTRTIARAARVRERQATHG